MASAYAAPGTQGQIMHPMDSGQQDVGAQLGNLIQLQNLQRQNLARPAIIQSLTGGQGGQGGQGGVDPNLLLGMSTDQIMKMAADKAAAGIGLQTDLAKGKQTDQLEAQTKLPDAIKAMGDVTNRINDIESATNADGSPVLQGILSNNSKKNAVMALMSSSEDPGWIASHWQQWQERGLTQQEISTIMNMKQLSSQAYGEAFTSTGSRRTQQEVNNLKSGLSQIGNINQPYDDGKGGGYLPQLNKFSDQLNAGLANSYGAAGQLDAIPDSLKFDANGQPLVNPIYRPGGSFYGGQGRAWTTQPQPKTQGQPSGGGKPLAGPDLDQVRSALAANPGDRARIHSTVQKNGYSTGGL